MYCWGLETIWTYHKQNQQPDEYLDLDDELFY